MVVMDVGGVVAAAQRGDASAVDALVREFQGMAIGHAFGILGDVDLARDAAQEAFAVALSSLGSLRNPMTFPAWFAKVVRSCSRRIGQARGPFERFVADEPVTASGTRSDALGDLDIEVRRAFGGLPAGERIVLALAVLGEHSHAEIAEFLGLPVSTIKKRAFDARRRLKGTIHVVEAAIRAEQSSRPARFGNSVLLFAAIRRNDVAELRRLLSLDPALAEVEEHWDIDEGRAAGLIYPAHGTPLVRAAELGHDELVQTLLDAGASVDGACGCATGETPLWAAAGNGKTGSIRLLLDHGANPNAVAGPAKVSALHQAVMRGNRELERLLLAFRADPQAKDANGKTPEDWRRPDSRPAPTREPATASSAVASIVETGLKALDLVCPLPRGGLVYWHGSYGLGQQVLLGELTHLLSPASFVWAGFESDLLDRAELEHLTAESGIDPEAISVRLIPADIPADHQPALLEATIREIEARAKTETLVVILVDRTDRRADIESYFLRLRGLPGILTTVVLTPRLSASESSNEIPAGYDAQIVLDPQRAKRGIYPAIDLTRSTSSVYASERHRRDAESVADELQRGADGRRALLHAYLSQPMRVSEPFLAIPGQRVPLDTTLDDVEAILRGECDGLAPADLVNKGALSDLNRPIGLTGLSTPAGTRPQSVPDCP